MGIAADAGLVHLVRDYFLHDERDNACMLWPDVVLLRRG
jgi:hypothetical protein